MKKIADFCEKAILYMYAEIYLLIFFLLIFGQWMNYYRKREFVISNIVIVVGTFLVFAGIVWIKRKKLLKGKQRNWQRLVKIASVILFLIQIFICINIFFMAGFDSKIITANADHIANGRTTELNNWYYSRWPNNTLLTAIYAGIFWCVEHIGIAGKYVRLIIVFLQCFLSTLTGAMIYQCVKRICNKDRISFYAWMLYVLLLGLSPWVVVPYSDSSCLFLPVFLFWMYQMLKNGKGTYWKAVAIGVTAGIGYELKPMMIIVFIAIVIIEILENIKKKANRKQWSIVLILLISIMGTMLSYQSLDLLSKMGFEVNEEEEFQIPHYLMMGLNDETSGTYWIEDTEYSAAIPTKKERSKENLRISLKRIKEYGISGLARHLAEKTLANFNDGTFSWGQEGYFYDTVPDGPSLFTNKMLRSYYYDDGKYHKVYEMISHIFWIFCIIGVTMESVCLRKQKVVAAERKVLSLSLIGIALFVTLFEARARYLYTFVPIFIVTSVIGYWNLFEKIRQIRCRDKVESVEE